MLSDTGRVRDHNEDAFAADPSLGLYVVCDGMGGAAGGEIASRLAADTFLVEARNATQDIVRRHRLREAALAANAAVFAEAARHPPLRGMGTTLVAVSVDRPAAQCWTVNVGDSRCYRLREGVLEQLTVDHSYLDEQVLSGRLTLEEAARSPLRSVITRAVGTEAHVEPDVAVHAIGAGDLLLLCSDGLTCEIDDGVIAHILKGSGSLPELAQHLVDAANHSGGRDNISVVLVRV